VLALQPQAKNKGAKKTEKKKESKADGLGSSSGALAASKPRCVRTPLVCLQPADQRTVGHHSQLALPITTSCCCCCLACSAASKDKAAAAGAGAAAGKQPKEQRCGMVFMRADFSSPLANTLVSGFVVP
jgi:hypothetical protein